MEKIQMSADDNTTDANTLVGAAREPPACVG